MAVSYKKLWKLLIDKDMKKKELEQQAKVSHIIDVEKLEIVIKNTEKQTFII